MPKVSVILPVYNCDQYIFETIQSVLNQTFADFELLIVDDCSTDKTVAIIKQFDDDRIQLILKEKNTGYTDSLNYAVSIAKGQYIARMDGDDICVSTRFEKQVAFLDANPTIILCGSAIQIIGTNTVLRHPSRYEDIKIKLCFSSSFYHPSVMARIEAFQANPYDKKYEPAEDYDLWTRLVFQGELANLEEVLLLYRVHENQVSNERKTSQEKHALSCKLNMFSHLQIKNYFNLDEINLVVGRQQPISFQECEKVQFVTRFLIEKNKELKVFDSFEFEREMEKHKIIQIKSFITKDKFLKWCTYSFFMKKCKFIEFLNLLNIKKRIKI